MNKWLSVFAIIQEASLHHKASSPKENKEMAMYQWSKIQGLTFARQGELLVLKKKEREETKRHSQKYNGLHLTRLSFFKEKNEKQLGLRSSMKLSFFKGKTKNS
jgi:hypothetical protein